MPIMPAGRLNKLTDSQTHCDSAVSSPYLCALPSPLTPGEPLREDPIEAVERRLGTVESIPANHTIEFLSDNGGAYIATQTRQMARALGLKPINTPVCSQQSNGMAESFVNKFRRDYLSDAPTVMRQLPVAFEHFNEVHPKH